MANGVQMANVQYNPSVDGILWNVALWTMLKPGPPTTRWRTGHRRSGWAARQERVEVLS